ncbi:MAG: asparagine synthase (glutamine-hydrolyzing) [Anaerotignum propionicum]|uniref:asparagine synthase (glutamine-hydrolyzing) n=1 Tax=Anaerotignum propionicum TaxID=28446 RepID=UPI002B21B9A3|nr:asparagine synthase (glutamine-hydrolyzing) [Anaerotignum propionicum]MEA5058029.1 asparagine synthase (glutamine-hydrolyzing) [Anaerotignum propionicum]
MCGIAGFFNPKKDYLEQKAYYSKILEDMYTVQRHRGPDDCGTFLTSNAGFAHARLSIIDLKTGHQPITRTMSGETWAIVYNGELYNTDELRENLLSKGWTFDTDSDTEVILVSYMEYGADFVKQLNGIFAFAIYDPIKNMMLLYRDRSGIKPLFYSIFDHEVVFSSEIKGIFAYPGIEPKVDKEGLNEVFSIGPAKTYGKGVFKGIDELLPGYYMMFSPSGVHSNCYWKLESHVHEDDYATTVEKTKELLIDSIKRQMVSHVPICTFLSGGVDSSLVSAVCAAELAKKGEQLNTFSFDFVGNEKYFKASSFQPSQDRPFVDIMVKHLNSNHRYLECSIQDQTNCLKDSVDARDLPAMADIDSSILYFCSKVKQYNKVALTGECADEIFGGYPWFHKKECFEANTFPWTMDLEARKVLLKDDFIEYLDMDDYVAKTYAKSVSETPKLAEDTPQEARRREIAYLNQKWFMQTLLDRMDRTSMYSGLEARVPFADYRLIEYVWNVPWEMKTRNDVVKSLLRECGIGLIPDDVLFRRKSPYPKIYDKNYETLLASMVTEIMEDSSSPVLQFLDRKKVETFLKSPSDYGKPWYGQLMAGPQMLAYVVQINYWMQKWNIKVV